MGDAECPLVGIARANLLAWRAPVTSGMTCCQILGLLSLEAHPGIGRRCSTTKKFLTKTTQALNRDRLIAR